MDGLTEFQPKKTAHTLFMDFVGYSRLPASSQAQIQQTLHSLAFATTPMQKTRGREDLIVKRTGDGMALIFFDDLDAPLKVALEMDERIKRQQNALREQIGGTAFRVRMGVHSGPVIVIEENGALDVAGEGVNVAQRVMDAGDAEHILISDVVAQALSGDPVWKSLFDDLGMCRVKHDELVHLHNVHGVREDGTRIGNEAMPPRVRATQETIQNLVERDAQRAREDTAQLTRSYVGRAGLVLGVLVALTTFATFLANGIKRTAAQTRRAQGIVIQKAKDKAAKDKAAKDAATDPNASPAPDASPGAEATPAPGKGLTGTADAQIPNLVGLSQTEAAEKCGAAGLKFALSQKTSQPSQTVPKDYVAAQFPAPGGRAPLDGAVYVTLSLGPDGGGAQAAISGIVVDIRGETGFALNAGSYLAGPDGTQLPLRFQAMTDETQAKQQAGGAPLEIRAIGANSSGGILLSAENAAQILALPADAQSKVVVLHR
jgi:class 3 adenylate cyclase